MIFKETGVSFSHPHRKIFLILNFTICVCVWVYTIYKHSSLNGKCKYFTININTTKLFHLHAALSAPSSFVTPVIIGIDVLAVRGFTVKKAPSIPFDSITGAKTTIGSISHS